MLVILSVAPLSNTSCPFELGLWCRVAHRPSAWSLHGGSSFFDKLSTTNRKQSVHFSLLLIEVLILGDVMKLAYVSSASDYVFEDTIASLIGLIASKVKCLLPTKQFRVFLGCARMTITIRQTLALALCG